MKKKKLNLLLCLLNDSTRVFEKIKDRMPVYVEVFSEKREREQFKWVFKNDYSTLKMKDKSKLPEEVLLLSEDFYNTLDDIFWFLMYTNEMPAAVQDILTRSIYKLEQKLTQLTSSINDYLTPEKEEDSLSAADETEDDPDISVVFEYINEAEIEETVSESKPTEDKNK